MSKSIDAVENARKVVQQALSAVSICRSDMPDEELHATDNRIRYVVDELRNALGYLETVARTLRETPAPGGVDPLPYPHPIADVRIRPLGETPAPSVNPSHCDHGVYWATCQYCGTDR